MNKCVERLYNGLIKENPTFVLTLGMCPTLAVTTSAINGIGMGLSSTVVLVMSNLMISLLRKIIPDGVRMPAFIVIVASFVTMVQFLMQGYLPSLYDSLGIYIPLIVVNCIILGRAEAYASKNPVLPSAFDGLGMGLGFTCAITILGAVRELIGAGTILSTGSSALVTIPESVYTPASIFILAPGAFFVLAMCIAIMNKIKAKHVDVHQAQNIGHADEHREHGQDHEIGQAGRRLGHPAAEIEQDRLPKEGDEGRSPELFHRGTSWGRMVLGILGTGLVLNLSTGA